MTGLCLDSCWLHNWRDDSPDEKGIIMSFHDDLSTSSEFSISLSLFLNVQFASFASLHFLLIERGLNLHHKISLACNFTFNVDGEFKLHHHLPLQPTGKIKKERRNPYVRWESWRQTTMYSSDPKLSSLQKILTANYSRDKRSEQSKEALPVLLFASISPFYLPASRTSRSIPRDEEDHLLSLVVWGTNSSWFPLFYMYKQTENEILSFFLPHMYTR